MSVARLAGIGASASENAPPFGVPPRSPLVESDTLFGKPSINVDLDLVVEGERPRLEKAARKVHHVVHEGLREVAFDVAKQAVVAGLKAAHAIQDLRPAFRRPMSGLDQRSIYLTFHNRPAGYRDCLKHDSRRVVRVKSYGELLQEYEFHPESKCADSQGLPCGKETIGLLQRRPLKQWEKESGKSRRILIDARRGRRRPHRQHRELIVAVAHELGAL